MVILTPFWLNFMRRFYSLAVFLLISIPAVAEEFPIRVSKETTFVTGPLNKDGYVNFAAAINAKMSWGITPETNAAGPIYQALGPAPGKRLLSPQFFFLLGVPAPPDQGDYFTSVFAFNQFEDADILQQIILGFDVARIQPWKRSDLPHMARWLDAQQGPLDLITGGAERDHYYCPLILSLPDVETGQGLAKIILGHIHETRSASRAIACRAWMHAGEGNNEAAWADLMTCVRLGRHIGHGFCLIENLIGSSIEKTAIKDMIRFVQIAPPDAKQVAQYKQELQSLPTKATMADVVNFGERIIYIDVVTALAVGKHDVSLWFGRGEKFAHLFVKLQSSDLDWNQVLKDLNERYDKHVVALKQPYAKATQAFAEIEAQSSKAEEFLEKNQFWFRLGGQKLSRQFKTETMSKLMQTLSIPTSGQYYVPEHKNRQYFTNLQTTLALMAYNSDEGVYPDSLKQLTPKYLKELPRDVFAGEEMKYSKTDDGFLLYSIGPNLKDDAGLNDKQEADDLAVRMPFSVDE